jgi:hypothetical protein
MDLPSGWSKATHRNPKTGETTCYYFNKEGLASHIPPLPSDHDDESSLDDDGGNSSEEKIDNRNQSKGKGRKLQHKRGRANLQLRPLERKIH